MADLGHIYLTAHGDYSTSPWTGERAQFGLRLPMTAAANEPGKGTIFTPISNGEVVLDSGTYSGTNGTLQRFWTARIGPTGSADNADAAMQADLADDVWSFLNTIKGYMHPQFRWTHVKIAPVAVGGAYAGKSAIYTFSTPLAGTNAGAAQPPEVALAVSLRAPIVGRRGRGRIYLPGNSIGTLNTNDGTVNSTAAGAIRDAMITLIGNLEDMPGVEEYGPCVAVMSASSTDAVRPSEVRVGSHFDVQRRRQHQSPETYVSASI